MRDLRVSFPKPCDEKWERMAPAGRARMCARCDKAVLDLAQYELAEAEALLQGAPGTCVRAVIDAGGKVALKGEGSGRGGRMIVAAAVAAGLLTGGEPALAKGERPRGAIAGKVEYYDFPARVIATDQGGRTFRARVRGNGRYRIKHVPPGTYTLTFLPDCGGKGPIGDIVVGEGETTAPDAKDGGVCIVIGMLRIEDSQG